MYIMSNVKKAFPCRKKAASNPREVNQRSSDAVLKKGHGASLLKYISPHSISLCSFSEYDLICGNIRRVKEKDKRSAEKKHQCEGMSQYCAQTNQFYLIRVP